MTSCESCKYFRDEYNPDADGFCNYFGEEVDVNRTCKFYKKLEGKKMQGDGPEEYADHQAELEAEAQAQGEAEQAEHEEMIAKQTIADMHIAISEMDKEIENLKKKLSHHNDRIVNLEG